MSDIFDIASENEELARDKALKFRKPEGPKPTGKCLWCDEPLEGDRRWCDKDCLDRWERVNGR